MPLVSKGDSVDEFLCHANIKHFKSQLKDATGVRKTTLLQLLELDVQKLRATLA